MRETKDTIDTLVEKMMSGDSHKIWEASCGICSLSRNHDKMMQLANHKKAMQEAVKGVNLGGLIASNNRFLDRAFQIIEFHERNQGCSCNLMGEDSNPRHLVEDGYFEVRETVYHPNSNYPDYYILQCNSCGSLFKVSERESHFTWWEWERQ